MLGQRSVVRLSFVAALILVSILFPASRYSPHRLSAQAVVGVQNMLRGFDKCNAPGSGTMNNWISSSPYYYIGIYIGGDNRACSNTNLTASWVSDVNGQTWSFIPFYVGLQDPCTSFAHTFSTDSASAESAGSNVADAAISTAENLGFTDSIIYYDLEGWGGTGGNCLSSAEAFVKGWTAELQSKGWTAGLYGSASGTRMDDMYGLNPRPQDADIAWPVGNTNPSWRSPWDIASSPFSVPNSDWENDHRIHQYYFDASAAEDCHGGICLTVDRQCAIGPTGKAFAFTIETDMPGVD